MKRNKSENIPGNLRMKKNYKKCDFGIRDRIYKYSKAFHLKSNSTNHGRFLVWSI